MLQWWSSMATK